MYPHHYWTKICKTCGWTYNRNGYRAGVCHLCAPWWNLPPLYDLNEPAALAAAKAELAATVARSQAAATGGQEP